MKPYTPNTDGIFRMPAADYHAAPGVGKHSLDYIADCPLKFALYRKYGMEPTDAMEMGTLCHTAVLEPELFGDSFHLKPGTYRDDKGAQKAWSGNSTVCKEWLAAHTEKPVVTQSELSRIQNIARNVREHPVVGPLLEEGEAEVSMFARCPLTGVMRKGRVDWIAKAADGGVWFVDFKFAVDATAQAFVRQVADLRYYVQHAYYVDLFELIMGVQPRFLFVAVEKGPMHEKSEHHRIQVYEMHALDVEMGRNHYTRDLRRYGECLERGEWPSDTDRIKTLELPKWVRRENAI